ncbi:putative proteasome regulatory particle subunit [Xylona heveae TC161]|uniref:Putative proteasome regulatory particle subunit n=1 Tax=Xylona heveae (strain CBS 132557 / TC161) TaxID=1328760 RepID=A0A165I7Q8_XYLHT|nr:putative proteasome regulatory particle subunit [Xylona heveae TC161]KZF24508.1 putative proteasome regulatory particle subunit [Xylona heveae TC161]
MDNRLGRMLAAASGMGGMSAAGPGQDTNLIDNSETVYISSLALLKMLRHGRAGVPMEVMGLMLGEFVDDYTVRVVDVFAMPQSGTGVSVEAVDPVFQTKMMDMLRQTGRPETVVGWYHSHPGFGCWLSSVDINTQQSFEQLTPRAVAVVVDPIQSVKGKVVIDAFRLINPQTLMMGHEPRQTTSNLGHLNKPSIQALIHGLNRHYYSIGINYRKTALEENMLMNLHKHVWTEALQMDDFRKEGERNQEKLQRLVGLAEGYEKRVKEETELTKDQLKTRYVGKVDPKKHLEDVGQQLIEDNIVSVSRQMIDKEASVARTNGEASGDQQGDMEVDDAL